MSYKIRTCKICGQTLHVRQIGGSLQIKNRCKHLGDEIITNNMLDDLTVSIREYGEVIGVKTIARICVTHRCKLHFVRYLPRSTELYRCSMCKILHELMSKKHIMWWMKKTWNDNWKAGDVKLIVGQNSV